MQLLGRSTMGREDRLVRGAIAFSLVLLGSFAILGSGGIGIVTGLFGAVGLYFAVTAALGRDPFYGHFGIDTRARDDVHEPAANPHAGLLDLRDSHALPTDRN